MPRAQDPAAIPEPAAAPSGRVGGAGSLMRVLAWAAVGWAIYALLVTAVLYFYLPVSGQGAATWTGLLRWAGVPTALWVLFTPAIIDLARRHRVLVPRPAAAVTVHVVAALVCHLVTSLFVFAVYPWLRGEVRPPIQAVLLQSMLLDLLRYAILVVGVHAVDSDRMYRARLAEALQLRSELAAAQLQVLKMQLQPHFLFNTLNAISELVYRDPRLADRALSRLADMLRTMLASAERQEIPLAEEITFLETYLDIERIRSGGALDVRIDVAVDAAPVMVPNLLLQPLAENALRHGLRGRAHGTLWIGARRSGDRLRIEIEDDGRGLPVTALHEGLGLRATRVRLHALYGAAYAFALRDRPGGGLSVTIELPAREGPAVAPAPPSEVAARA